METRTRDQADLAARRTSSTPRGVVSACPVFIDHALNSEIWDGTGRRYIDFAGGIAVLNVGHCHPRVVAAIQEQATRYLHAAFQVQPYEPYVSLAERLNALAPGPGPKKTIFLSSGAEAVENAVKIARAHTGRHGVITFTGGFHGRTLLTLAMTGKVTPYKAGFGPFPGAVHHVPYPHEYRGIGIDDSLHALQRLFIGDIAPTEVAAIVIEPVLGEGGYLAAPAEFLQRLRDLCDAHGIVLVADEIQSGFGRAGAWFAIESSGVVPDLITVAKSLAGGMPLSGVIGRADIMDAAGPGGLGGTYGGNPVACAAAHAVLDVLEEEDLCGRAAVIGEHIHAWGSRAQKRLPCLGEIRGPGAMIGIELVRDPESREPDSALTVRVRKRALAHGLLILGCGIHGNVLRIMVPLTVSDEILDEGLAILERAIEEAVSDA